jgi:carboxypeptidase Q
MQRMQDRGQVVTVTLNMQAFQYPDVPSRNVIIDFLGATKPGEVVVVSGHVDSWDIAEGAMDDGGGVVTSWEAVRTIKMLVDAGAIDPPARTIRAVMWTNEENGDRGGEAYAAALGPPYVGPFSLANHSAAIETDIGGFQPYGIGVGCVPGADCGAALAQMTLIGNTLLAGIGSGNVSEGGGGTDVEPSCDTGVVCMGTNVLDPRLTGDSNNPCTNDAMGAWSPPSYSPTNMPYDSYYFWIHHSAADTIERMDPRQLNHHAAALAVWSYAVAQLPELLPRNESAPTDLSQLYASASAPAPLRVRGGLTGSRRKGG